MLINIHTIAVITVAHDCLHVLDSPDCRSTHTYTHTPRYIRIKYIYHAETHIYTHTYHTDKQTHTRARTSAHITTRIFAFCIPHIHACMHMYTCAHKNTHPSRVYTSLNSHMHIHTHARVHTHTRTHNTYTTHTHTSNADAHLALARAAHIANTHRSNPSWTTWKR